MQQALGFLMHCQSPSPLLYSERVREERPKKETSKMTNTWLPHAPSVTLSTALLRERERERERERGRNGNPRKKQAKLPPPTDSLWTLPLTTLKFQPLLL